MMKDKMVKPDIGFNEALQRIANTPKSAILDRHVEKTQSKDYNAGKEATKKPPPAAKRGA